MHNSENIISYSSTILALVGVFRSLHYVKDLTSAALLVQAVPKLPPNLKEAWSMHTVKNQWSCPTLLEFNGRLKEKAEADEMMKVTSLKQKPDDNSTTNTKTKTALKYLLQHPQTTHRLLDVVFFQRSLLSVPLVKKQTLCGVALCFVEKQQRRGQNLLLITNFAFRA